MRLVRSICALSVSCLALAGCTHALETRTINAFIHSLEQADLEDLKSASSTDFQELALRRQEAGDALKSLHLPTGKIEILEVKEVDEEHRKVLATVGEQKRKMIYSLIREEGSGKWVVDDVHFKKNLKPGQVNKPVSEQMDLLLSITEIITAWQSGDRETMSRVTTEELRESLAALPDSALQHVAKMTTEGIKTDTLSPRIDGHKNSAMANITRKGGSLALKLKQQDDKWLLEDLAVVTSREQDAIPSLKKYAAVLHNAIAFYQAYQQGDKQRLEQVTEGRFYRLNLSAADLAEVPLPTVPLAEGKADVRVLGSRAEVLAQAGNEILRITLSQGTPQLIDSEKAEINIADQSRKPYLVEDVAIHDLNGKQEKRLSALFSSQAIVGIFAESLAEQDLKAIRLASTVEFNSRVWERVNFEQLHELPLQGIPHAPPDIVDTQFKGPITEVTVNQGDTPITYVLREQGGTLLVDDVLRPTLDTPQSLKMTLEILLPLYEFRTALAAGKLDLLRKNASREFNRMVFHQLAEVPGTVDQPLRHLQGEVTHMQVTPDRAILTVGSERWGAKVFLNREAAAFVIDDVILISGVAQTQRAGLKQQLREQVLSGTSISAAPKNGSDDPLEQLLQQEIRVP